MARSVRHLCEIVDQLQAKGVALRILKMNLDTNDATGKLMLQIIGSIAEFERSIMLSRQLEGIAKAKAEGKYRGGVPTARAKAEQVFALVDAGKTKAEVAEELGISIRSVFRILRTRKDADQAPVASPVRRARAAPRVSASQGRQSRNYPPGCVWVELVLRLQRPDKTSHTSPKPPSTDRKERREQAKPGGAWTRKSFP